jgi:hypothetical protein
MESAGGSSALFFSRASFNSSARERNFAVSVSRASSAAISRHGRTTCPTSRGAIDHLSDIDGGVRVCDCIQPSDDVPPPSHAPDRRKSVSETLERTPREVKSAECAKIRQLTYSSCSGIASRRGKSARQSSVSPGRQNYESSRRFCVVEKNDDTRTADAHARIDQSDRAGKGPRPTQGPRGGT